MESVTCGCRVVGRVEDYRVWTAVVLPARSARSFNGRDDAHYGPDHRAARPAVKLPSVGSVAADHSVPPSFGRHPAFSHSPRGGMPFRLGVDVRSRPVQSASYCLSRTYLKGYHW